MNKVFILEDLCCANCAKKIEDNVAKLDGVNSVSVAFLSQKMKIEFDDTKEKEIISEVKKIVKKVDSDVEIIEK